MAAFKRGRDRRERLEVVGSGRLPLIATSSQGSPLALLAIELS